jgi:hypothetical protein
MRPLVVFGILLVGCQPRPAAHPVAPPPSTGYAASVSATPAPVDVSESMAARAQDAAYDLVPSSYLEHGTLGEGQEESFNTVLEAGHCYRILGVGGPTMSDLDLSLRDENGNLLAEDGSSDAAPILGLGSDLLCPRWTGAFYVTVRARRGSGDYGIQIFRTP